MKFKATTEVRAFEPVSITITCETREELNGLQELAKQFAWPSVSPRTPAQVKLADLMRRIIGSIISLNRTP